MKILLLFGVLFTTVGCSQIVEPSTLTIVGESQLHDKGKYPDGKYYTPAAYPDGTRVIIVSTADQPRFPVGTVLPAFQKIQ